MAALTQAQLRKLHRALEARYTTLVSEAREELRRSGDDDLIEPLARVLDGGDGAVADLLATLDAAGADRHMAEVRAIVDAGNRIRHGTYGACIECGDDVGFERLQAMPTATRCMTCQERTDRDFGSQERHTL